MPHLALELRLLLAAAGIGMIQVILAAAAALRQRPLDWAAGARDEILPPLTGVAGRLDRAFRNFQETFPIFVVVVLAAYLGGHAGRPLGVWGATLYVVARAIYAPVYVAGIAYVRTLVWGLSLVGIGMVAAAALG
jgi:uncharacterized MAPEG superfamily protein